MIWPADWPDVYLGEVPVRPCERTPGTMWGWCQDKPCPTAVQQVGIMENKYLAQLLSEMTQ